MRSIIDHVKQLYLAYFAMKLGDRDKSWAHHKIFTNWSMINVSGSKGRTAVRFGDITEKNQKLLSYPDNISSVIRLVPIGSNIQVPLPPADLRKISRYIRSQVDRGNLSWSRYSQAYKG
ncbi:hypothetical protein TNCV_1982591 [Trichonephila clavipes]|nr:hypothetical protein TNCV_1982591 [Trichonephila clavipes]